MGVLRNAGASLEMWCYCLEHTVDYLNYTAHCELNSKVPLEVLTGHTPDISMFRFKFWEPVWYYEPTARFLSPNFLPGRHIGIAWHHGDAFTYKIWATLDGKCEDGRLLIRNDVKARDVEELSSYVDYPTSVLIITRKNQRNVVGKERESVKLTLMILPLLFYGTDPYITAANIFARWGGTRSAPNNNIV